ncbi:MAG: hypothetical protein HC767_11455 [Akkermansiaceae bacterium]|nr:hypothetical protein [Akkermansiaceae bacterium]
MREATDKVRQGMSLQRAMAEAQVFPPMMIAMVASGEASGHLGRALDHAATEQQRDLDAWVKAVVALVEPAILVVSGGAGHGDGARDPDADRRDDDEVPDQDDDIERLERHD